MTPQEIIKSPEFEELITNGPLPHYSHLLYNVWANGKEEDAAAFLLTQSKILNKGRGFMVGVSRQAVHNELANTVKCIAETWMRKARKELGVPRTLHGARKVYGFGLSAEINPTLPSFGFADYSMSFGYGPHNRNSLTKDLVTLAN